MNIQDGDTYVNTLRCVIFYRKECIINITEKGGHGQSREELGPKNREPNVETWRGYTFQMPRQNLATLCPVLHFLDTMCL